MSQENLSDKEAIKKLQELATSIDFALMSTNLSEFPIATIPMSTKKVDDEGNIWFLSGKDSNHNSDILEDARVQLSYADKDAMEFLIVSGYATISESPELIDELYGKSDNMWFDGKDDPNVTVLKVVPEDCQYWDPKYNKFVSIIKMGISLLQGEKPDVMDYGELDI